MAAVRSYGAHCVLTAAARLSPRASQKMKQTKDIVQKSAENPEDIHEEFPSFESLLEAEKCFDLESVAPTKSASIGFSVS